MSDEQFAPFERETKDHLPFVRKLAESEKDELANNEFTPKILFHTDEDEIRAVVFPQIDNDMESRHKIAWIMTVLSAAIDNLWSVALVCDTYHVKQTTKHDGSTWGPGEMQHAFTNNTVDADLVTEALTYQIIEGDRMSMAVVPYEKEDGGITFDWDSARCDTEDEAGRYGGFFPDAMRQAYTTPKILAMAEASQFAEVLGMDLDATRIHTLCAAVKIVMTQTETPVLIPCKNEDEAAILKSSFDRDNPFNAGAKFHVLDQDDVAEIENLESAFNLPGHGLNAPE